MLTLEEITVDERLIYIERRLVDLEEFLNEVADDFLSRFGGEKGEGDEAI